MTELEDLKEQFNELQQFVNHLQDSVERCFERIEFIEADADKHLEVLVNMSETIRDIIGDYKKMIDDKDE